MRVCADGPVVGERQVDAACDAAASRGGWGEAAASGRGGRCRLRRGVHDQVGSPILPTSVFTLWLQPGSCVAL